MPAFLDTYNVCCAYYYNNWIESRIIFLNVRVDQHQVYTEFRECSFDKHANDRKHRSSNWNAGKYFTRSVGMSLLIGYGVLEIVADEFLSLV